MSTEINTGELINEYFERKRIRRAALSRVMGKTLRAIMKYEKNETIQTRILIELSYALRHNFFMDIAMMLPPEFTTTKDIFDEKNRKIDELQQEVEALKREKELLMELIKSKM